MTALLNLMEQRYQREARVGAGGHLDAMEENASCKRESSNTFYGGGAIA